MPRRGPRKRPESIVLDAPRLSVSTGCVDLSSDLDLDQQRPSTMAALQVGNMVEVPVQDGSARRRRGRPAGVGHFHEQYTPNHFMKVLFQSELGMLPIPDGFRPHLRSIPSKIILRTNTGCNWEITMKEVDGRAVLDQGWPAFAIAHQLRVGYLLCFKKISLKEYRVIIFDYSCCEVVAKCPEHADAFKRIDDPAPMEN